MGKRALVLINRHSRQGQQVLAIAADELRKQGLDVLEPPAGLSDRPAALIRRYHEQVDLVVVGGGDGSLNLVAEALVETGVTLGVLPLGTANDLARTLGIPSDLPAACQVIGAGHSRPIDLGWINGRHYFNAAGIGLSVEITRRLSREVKGRWGTFAYVNTALQAVLNARPFTARIRGETESVKVKTLQIIVGNGVSYGGWLTVAPDAAIDDRRLDLYSLEVKNWWQLVPLVPGLFRGALESYTQARTMSGQEFEIRTSRPYPVNADGEIIAHTPARFRVVPKAIRVLAPPSGGLSVKPPAPA